MIQRSTRVIFGVFVLLLTTLLVYQQVNLTESLEVTPDPFSDIGTLEPVSLLFLIPEGEFILGLHIEDFLGNTLEINNRNENEDWVFVDLDAGVDQESINRLISQLGTLSIDRALEPDLDLEVIGLAELAYTFDLEVSNGSVFIMNIGGIRITGRS
jgi:hypothetical protein